MCQLRDFDNLVMDSEHRGMLRAELRAWHRSYLPPTSLVGKTVLDIGAGNGETAQFFLNHGAEHVISIEPYAGKLMTNFGKDSRVTIIPRFVNHIKSDCEGGERYMAIETHFPFYLSQADFRSTVMFPTSMVWRVMPILPLEPVWNGWGNFHRMKIQLAHFIRQTLEYELRPRHNGHDDRLEGEVYPDYKEANP